MAEALDPAAYVYEGIWTDWSKGRITGVTWTLCPNKATLLTNSLALFVTLAGGQLWTIIRFGLHQRRVSQKARHDDECQAHEQVVLRNTATDLHTMRLMAQVAWLSRSKPGTRFSYPLAIACLAILHYTFFLVAGTFSNKLVNPSSNKLVDPTSAVLSRSPHCGVWSTDYLDVVNAPGFTSGTLDDLELIRNSIAKLDHNVQLSQEYAQQCYRSNATSHTPSKCDTLPKSNLWFDQRISNEPCPFGLGMCNGEQVLVFNTNAIDSHRDLGINAPKKDRLTYQRRTMCAVLNDTGRVIESNQSTSEAMAQAYYGSSLMQSTNFTYSFSNFSSLYTEFTPQSTIPYQVNTQLAYGASQATEYLDTFVPLPELSQTSADLVLFFLSFNGRYFEPIDDPWFSAHELHLVDTKLVIARKQFARDRLISTLGCRVQHQFCNPKGVCTPFLGWGQVQDVKSFTTGLTPHQAVLFDRMIRAATASSISQVVTSLATTKTPLLAIDQAATQTHVVSLKLPDNQWELELRNWHSIAMAQFQRTMVQWSTGQIAPDPETQLVRPETEPDAWFCRNLRVPSTVYQSFSILYLVLILTIGMLVILVSWNVEGFARWIQLQSSQGSASRIIWDDDHMLGSNRATNRKSWKPRPPPKDYTAPQQGGWPLKGEQLAPPQPIYNVHEITDDWTRRSRFPRFLTPGNTGAFGDDHQKLLQRPTTPRMWSQLPPEPARDSWVEMSLRGNEPESEETVQHFPAYGSKKTSIVSTAAQGRRALQLTDLRAHALARTRDPWG